MNKWYIVEWEEEDPHTRNWRHRERRFSTREEAIESADYYKECGYEDIKITEAPLGEEISW